MIAILNYIFAEHLQTPEEVQLYFEICNEESGVDKALMSCRSGTQVLRLPATDGLATTNVRRPVFG